MPRINPLGVARQITDLTARIREACEDANNLVGEERQERIADALLWASETNVWIDYAGRQSWHTVVRHGITHTRLINAYLETIR